MGSSQSSHVKSKAASKKKQQPKELKDVRGRESKEDKTTISEIVANKEAETAEAFVYATEEQQGLVATDESSEYDEETDDDQDEDEEYDAFLAERLSVLEDAKKLKQLAVMFSHPEEPVMKTTDPCAFGRNFFSRPSAPEQESLEEAEERARILEDAQLLKKYAVDYAHPELAVVTTDGCACGRNFFERASAPEVESFEDMEEHERVLADVRALKQLAVDSLHPERPVETTDPYAMGRNYYSRFSAPEQESKEEAEERARVLADAQLLTKFAVDYAHPELPVVTTDFTACGRNYFDRASAPEQESLEDMEARELVLADMEALKKLAVDYAHPELPVTTTDAYATGRNYFDRPSAPEQETFEEAEERARILVDAMHLEKFAVDYAHPELKVETTDATVTGRNYFGRASAVEQESPEEAEERARILADCTALKKLAVDFLHPEVPCKTTDPYACGRNFYRRASAKGNFDVITSTAQPVDFHALEDRFHLESHFDMDDELHLEEHLDEFVHHLHDVTHSQGFHWDHKDHPANEKELDAEEEGKLSRSPSSVMLFGLEAAY